MISSTGNPKRDGKGLLITAVIVLASFLLAGVVSKYCYQLVLIQGDSMEPTYHNGQLVIIDKMNRDYRCGDVIAFYSETEGICVIKRIAENPKGETADGYYVLGDNREHSIDSRDPRIGMVKENAIIGKVL